MLAKQLKTVAISCLALCAALATAGGEARAETIQIGIGTQNTTTNTVTGGVVLRELGLFEKHLPHTGRYKDVRYSLSWQNSTSGPPITNGMMADNIQIGMMGDYPLLVNGATGQATGNPTRLIAVIAYSAVGGGNGIVVNKASPFFQLEDLKSRNVSVPFGSAAHGMMLHALEERGLPTTFWNLVSQSPEVGSTNLQEQRIDGNGGFVPFPELLPFRKFARKIFDGAETGIPTFHGVVVRKDFGEKYPEIVEAYVAALMEANAWLRKDPAGAAEKVQRWTGIEKEVVYVYLGPGGIQTLDPTIKPAWVDAMKVDYQTLRKLNLVKELDVGAWVDDRYVRKVFQDQGLDYAKQLAAKTNYAVSGEDAFCKKTIADPAQAGQVWVEGGGVTAHASPVCTLAAAKSLMDAGKGLNAVYLVDHRLGEQVFADQAFYAITDADPKAPSITPFLLRKDAEAFAREKGGRLATYTEALESAARATR